MFIRVCIDHEPAIHATTYKDELMILMPLYTHKTALGQAEASSIVLNFTWEDIDDTQRDCW
jgi:hypothetical protein